MIDIDNFEVTDDFTELNVLVGEYSFVVCDSKVVRVRVWYNQASYGGNRYSFTQSQYFHGPNQGGPYMTSAPFADSEEAALRKAMSTFVIFWPADGTYDPENVDTSSWFVPNERF
jgi:hypothetical protein